MHTSAQDLSGDDERKIFTFKKFIYIYRYQFLFQYFRQNTVEMGGNKVKVGFKAV